MVQQNRNALRQAKVLLYKLKRNFGTTVTLWIPSSGATHNRETGAISRSFTVQRVRRCIVLTSHLMRSFEYDLSYIAANKNFTYGGFFDKDTRLFIIDAKDVTVELDANMHIVFDEKRYEIKDISETENNTGYAVTGNEVKSTDDYASDYTITGTVDPSVGGEYYKAGTYNSQDYYVSLSGLFIIWYDTALWNISRVLGTIGEQYWTSATLASAYTAAGDATGVATVTAS